MANRLRQDVIKMVSHAGSGISPDRSIWRMFLPRCISIFSRHDPKRPDWPDRDRLVLSNGHICPVQYAALGARRLFPG